MKQESRIAIENRESRIENRESRIENRESRIKDRETRNKLKYSQQTIINHNKQ
jgi:hypothetical protein